MKRISAAVVLMCAAVSPILAGVAAPVPEPGTMLLVGGGVAATILIVRKRQKK
jgi:hypothetical protein